MGFFGSLFGFSQSNAAVNAVLASHLLDTAHPSERQRIAAEVASILASVQRGRTAEVLLQSLSGYMRPVQMNFVALACSNLGIRCPGPASDWTRVKNPYMDGGQVTESYAEASVNAVRVQDKLTVRWPGNDVKVDFNQMLNTGELS